MVKLSVLFFIFSMFFKFSICFMLTQKQSFVGCFVYITSFCVGQSPLLECCPWIISHIIWGAWKIQDFQSGTRSPLLLTGTPVGFHTHCYGTACRNPHARNLQLEVKKSQDLGHRSSHCAPSAFRSP